MDHYFFCFVFFNDENEVMDEVERSGQKDHA